MRSIAILISCTTVSLVVGCGDNVKQPVLIGGTVSGLEGSGLVLHDSNGESLAIDQDGPFAFTMPIVFGGDYEVTVASQPTSPAQTCTVANGSGRIMSDDAIDNISVTCKTGVFTVGGTVTGLAGAGLILQNNGTDDLAITADGTFTFATPIASGAAFAVTVKTQPSGPTQTCTVSGGTGTVGAGPVTSVAVDCATDHFTVGGTVSGLVGTGLVLQNNGGDDLVITGDGTFTFSTPVASGAVYAVTVLTQPTSPTQICTVTSDTGTVGGSNVTDVAVTCVTSTFTIGGMVSGLVGTGLVLQDNGGDDLQVLADGSFTFATPIASGATFDVTVAAQPSGPTQTCTVSGGTGMVGAGDVTSILVNCTTNTYAIGGTISGLVGMVTLQNNGGDDLVVSSNGTFSFLTPVASGDVYSVTVLTQPGSPAQTCTVTAGSGSVTNADITSVVVTCTTNRYAIRGTLSGLASGNTIVVQNNGADDLTLSADGSFMFSVTVASGQPYAVTIVADPVSPVAQTCSVSNASGTVGAADVTDVLVQCTTNTYTIGGTVSGLLGGTLVLLDNAGDPLTITSNGSFTFATPVASGATYAVTVGTQPSSQTCTVTAGSGSVAASNITNVTVSCIAAACGRFNGTTGATWSIRASAPGQGGQPGWTDSSAIGGSSFFSLGGTAFARYDGPANTWTNVAAAPVNASSWASPAWVGNYIYSLAGGSVQRYDVAAGTWTVLLTGLATAAQSQNAHDDVGNVYTFASTGAIIRYNIATNTATTLTTGISGLSEPRLTWDSCTQKLYVAPSFAGGPFYSFDPVTSTRTTLTPIPEAAGFMNDITCSDRSGHIYAAGGSSGTTFWRYDTQAGTWSTIPATPFDHGNNGACAVTDDGFLYITPSAGASVARIQLN